MPGFILELAMNEKDEGENEQIKKLISLQRLW